MRSPWVVGRSTGARPPPAGEVAGDAPILRQALPAMSRLADLDSRAIAACSARCGLAYVVQHAVAPKGTTELRP